MANRRDPNTEYFDLSHFDLIQISLGLQLQRTHLVQQQEENEMNGVTDYAVEGGIDSVTELLEIFNRPSKQISIQRDNLEL